MKLNWGSAFDSFDGWVASDLNDYGQEHVGDLLDGLPWPDDTFEVVVANHALTMITYHQMPTAIAELRRVLRPGGRLRVLVPDALAAFRAFEMGDAAWFTMIADDVQPTIGGKLSAYLTWYSEARTVFTPQYLAQELLAAGFTVTARVGCWQTVHGLPGDTETDKRPNESLIMEAVK